MSPLLPLWFPPPLKKTIIIPVPLNSKPYCLNDNHPVALTSIVMKVFGKLVKNHICSYIPVTLDLLQFAYRPNRSTGDDIQTQVKKARQRLYHLRQLRKFRVSPAILKTFYSGAIGCASQCGMETPPIRTVKLSWAHLRVCSPLSAGHLPQTLQKAELLKSSTTQITLVTVFSFYCHLASTSGTYYIIITWLI